MNRKVSLVLFFTVLLFSASVKAQKVDLLNQSGYRKGELPVINQPVPKLKGDPWIFQAYSELFGGRQPNAWELNIYNYNNGSWNSYAQLKEYIQKYQNLLKQQGIEIRTGGYNSNIIVGFFKGGKQVAVNVVSAGGGNVVAAGGANVVSAGGANVVSAGGANVVAAGGANIMAASNLAAAKPGQGF